MVYGLILYFSTKQMSVLYASQLVTQMQKAGELPS